MPSTSEIPTEAPRQLAWPGFVLDLDRGELLDVQGNPADLRAQALRLLLVLGERAGRLVSKDELMARVWGQLVVTEDSLVQAVRDIRRVLGDSTHTRVRSVPKRGYMLVCDEAPAPHAVLPDPVQVGVEPAESLTAAPAPVPQMSPASESARGGWRAALVVVACCGLLLAASGAWWATKTEPDPGPPLRSLAILPFQGDGTVEDWFLEAMGADLHAKVAGWSATRLIGRGSLMAYQGVSADPRMVAREFGVRYVVTGHARRSGALIQFDLQMVDGADGRVAWAHQFHIERARLEQAVADITGGLARVVFYEWGQEIGNQVRTLDPMQVEADDEAMQAFSIFLKGLGPDSMAHAGRMFESALAKDPRSLRALGGVSLTNSMGVLFGWAEHPELATHRAEETVARMEELNSTDFLTLDARLTVANMRADYATMLATSVLMLQHYPNDHSSHHAHCSALLRLGRFEESMPSCERAIQISPRDSRAPVFNGLIATNLFMLGRYDAAATRARLSVAANGKIPFYSLVLAAALQQTGHDAEAREVVADVRSRHPAFHTDQIVRFWPSTQPDFVEGRQRIVDSVRALGMP